MNAATVSLAAMMLIYWALISTHPADSNLWTGLYHTGATIVLSCSHETILASITAVCAAVFLWLWWKGRGGRKARKRLLSKVCDLGHRLAVQPIPARS